MNQGTPVAPAGNSPFELCRVDDRGAVRGSRGAAALVTSTSSALHLHSSLVLSSAAFS